VSAQLDGLLPAATSFCAVAMMQDVLVLWRRVGGSRVPWAARGNEAARSRPHWQPYDSAPVTRPSRLGQN
jgi:hypothetical protein